MDTTIISDLFRIVLIPLLGAITTFVVKMLNAKTKEVKERTKNDMVDKYLDLLSNTIADCVIATNQTYVDSLKKAGNFDHKAQEEAFSKTYEAVMAILSDDAKEYLSLVVGDLQVYIIKQIESNVKTKKQPEIEQ